MDRNLLALHSPESFESEQFKVLRSKLTTPCCVLVTSALVGEGKTFVSSNLAVSIAQTMEKSALLLDCDLRMPALHHIFDTELSPGLSEYLAEEIPPARTIRETSVPKLTLFPGGRPPLNPAELLSSEKMTRLIQGFKKEYHDRYLIIDSPPLLLMSEARTLSHLADSIILVIAAGRTPRHLVSELVEAIGKEKIIGAILNRFEGSSLLSRYNRRKKYSAGNEE